MGKQYPGVRPRGDTIQIDFHYKAERFRETLLYKPTAANLKKAHEFRQSIYYAMKLGTFVYSETFPDSKAAQRLIARKDPIGGVAGNVDTVKTFLTAWLAGQKHVLKASTYANDRRIVDNELIPQFGELRLTDVKRDGIIAWLEPRAGTNKTLSNLQSVLRRALDNALDKKRIEFNPLAAWTYSRMQPPKETDDIEPFDREEMALILIACVEPQERNMVQFLFWTGLRTSEIVGLRWRDIDWRRAKIFIRRAITHAARRRGVENDAGGAATDPAESPKTAAGRREVALHAPALEALKAQKPYSFLLDDGAIFLNPRTGKAWHSPKMVDKAWQRIMKRSKVRYRNQYQTRHTFASMMLSAGEPELWVAKQMGHRDVGMIRRNYGRWMPDAAPDAGSKAVALFWNVQENKNGTERTG